MPDRKRDLFSGSIGAWVYACLRIGFALVFLIRESSLLAPLVPLEHHRWVHGLDFSWSVAREPHLVSPLVPGLALGAGLCSALGYLRIGLAVMLLLGVRSRASAALLALVSYWLMFSDRFQYLHHLHLLFLSIAWLSLAPLDGRFSVERWLRGAAAAQSAPVWPLVLLRAMVISIYLASGLAKLNQEWLDGETLHTLETLGTLHGRGWLWLRSSVGYAAIARAVALIELLLPILLARGVTRRFGVLCGWALHLGVSLSMSVSTFGVEMALLLVAFWVTSSRDGTHAREGRAPRLCLPPRLRTMLSWTRLG
jgi:uncharacterized membrane protein YphA (DoxX/SURF4 family)